MSKKTKAEFFILTDGDLMYWYGKKEEMLMKLQIKLGKSRQGL